MNESTVLTADYAADILAGITLRAALEALDGFCGDETAGIDRVLRAVTPIRDAVVETLGPECGRRVFGQATELVLAELRGAA